MIPSTHSIGFVKEEKYNDEYKIEADARGWNNTFIPLINFEQININVLADILINNAEQYEIIIFTSHHACDIFMNSLNYISDDKIKCLWYNKYIFGVGKSTLSTLSNCFKNVMFSNTNAEELLVKIKEFIMRNYNRFQSVHDSYYLLGVLFLCGDKRMDTIPMGLEPYIDIIINYKELVIYNTVNNIKIKKKQYSKNNDSDGNTMSFLDNIDEEKMQVLNMFQNLDYLVFFSPSGVKAFYELMANEKINCNYIAIGNTTYNALKKYNIPAVITSTRPNAKSLFSCLDNYQLNS